MLEKIHIERWYNNASVLTKDLDEFFPSENLDLNCKINSIARLAIYFSFFIVITGRNQKWLALSLLLLLC